jgi:two-component system, NtrC family, sensor kinase
MAASPGSRMSTSESDATVRGDAELSELDRLRAACVLSAGLAHEVANPLLGVISNLAEIERLYPRLRADMGPAYAERWETLVDCLDQARRSADAIADVVRDFQAFLRPASNRIERFVEVGPLVERAIRMAGPQLKQAACVRMQIEKTVPVKSPPSYITQIALNLLLNATEALSTLDSKRNRVEIRVKTEGPTVVLEVEDNGPGLDEAAAARVFEPHFTSKMSGTSLGLGLSICRSMVEKLGGTISLRSTPGEGTRFRVEFPISSRVDAPASG